jgi:TetR/AcrR family transcriptional regulator, cholesterol catabolism regulator
MTDTRNHIMEVARSQFFKTGFAGTSINSIVDATKFTKPTVYYHFKNKAELFASLVHDAYDRCFEHRRNAVDPKLPAAEQLYQAVAADFAFCLATPDLVRFVVALTFALPGDHSIDLSAIHSRDHESFRALIERGMSTGEFDCVDSGDAAIAVQGLIAINIMSYLKMGHPPEFLSSQRARDVADVLLKGIAPKGKVKGLKKGPKKRSAGVR